MQQIRRLGVAIVGLGLVLLGVVMLVAPGPVWLAVLLGLGVLAAEFLWARWLRKGAELIDSLFGRDDISKLAASRERERTSERPSRRRRVRSTLSVNEAQASCTRILPHHSMSSSSNFSTNILTRNEYRELQRAFRSALSIRSGRRPFAAHLV
jgi:Putative transmembrane protein (PGPGW)